MNKKSSVPSYFLFIGLFLICFWVFFPFAMKELYSSDYTEFSEKTKDSITGTNSFRNIVSGIGVYLKFMFIAIPSVNPIIKIIVYFLQFLSFLFIIILFGDLAIALISKLSF